MINKFYRIVALLLVITAMISISAVAAYDPPDSPDASSYISSYSVSIINGGSGKLKVDFYVTATGVMQKIGATSIAVYKCNGTYVGTIWYTNPGRSGMMGSNDYYHSDLETYTVTPGSYYVVVTLYAKNSSGFDSIPVTTGCKTIT